MCWVCIDKCVVFVFVQINMICTRARSKSRSKCSSAVDKSCREYAHKVESANIDLSACLLIRVCLCDLCLRATCLCWHVTYICMNVSAAISISDPQSDCGIAIYADMQIDCVSGYISEFVVLKLR